MPVISLFYGLIVTMYFYDNRKHHLPHIHVKYQDEEAVISILDGQLIEGTLKNNKMKLYRHGLKSTMKNYLPTGN